jgi:uncharacterized BrkB/YihY/UPF0761 family membrane protein
MLSTLMLCSIVCLLCSSGRLGILASLARWLWNCRRRTSVVYDSHSFAVGFTLFLATNIGILIVVLMLLVLIAALLLGSALKGLKSCRLNMSIKKGHEMALFEQDVVNLFGLTSDN